MKKPTFFNTIVAAAIALPLCFAFAQDEEGKGKGKGKGGPGGGSGAGKGRPQGFQPPKFGDIDTDSSGGVNKEEWLAYQMKMARQRADRSFGYLAGDDGEISEDELKKAVQRRGGPGGGKGGPGGSSKGGKGKGMSKGGGESDTGGGTKPKRPAIEE